MLEEKPEDEVGFVNVEKGSRVGVEGGEGGGGEALRVLRMMCVAGGREALPSLPLCGQLLQ